MAPICNQRRIILYKNILNLYPIEVKKYILSRTLDHQSYIPDITTVLRLSKDKKVDTYLWFDLYKTEDIFSFIPPKFKTFVKEFILKADIIIVGTDVTGYYHEFFLEFNNKKINIINDIIKAMQQYFSCDVTNIINEVNQVKGFLDQKNYFMCGIKYTKHNIEEFKFYFNVNKKELSLIEMPKYFSQLLNKFSVREFRGEKSYIIGCNGEIVSKIGWMVNCNFLPNFVLLIKTLNNLSWTKPLIEKLNFYANKKYASFLRWGWFSYLYSNNNIQAINIMLNYNDGT